MPQSKPLLFFIDALDEEFLEELSIKALDANVSLNICLSSRHYPTISMQKRLELVVEEKTEHDDDIMRYVRDKLKKENKDVEKEILSKVDGVFMWVILVVALLNQAYDEGKVEAMHQRLHELPGDLEQVFETLLSIDNPDKQETVLLLQCVLFARRAMRSEELYFAMMAGTNAENLGAWDQSKVTNEDIQRRITSSSRGLIEIRKGKGKTVQFIHETVNNFLLRNARLQTLDPMLESNVTGTSHGCLTACSMSYLMMEGLVLAKGSSHARSLGIRYPFLEYAATHFLRHAEEAQRRGVAQKNVLQSLQNYERFERLRRFHNSYERIPGLRCGKGATPLYTLSLHGYHELIKLFLSKG